LLKWVIAHFYQLLYKLSYISVEAGAQQGVSEYPQSNFRESLCQEIIDPNTFTISNILKVSLAEVNYRLYTLPVKLVLEDEFSKELVSL